MKALLTILLIALSFVTYSQQLTIRTVGTQYNGIKSCDPDKIDQKCAEFALQDGIEITFNGRNMITTTFNYDPQGELHIYTDTVYINLAQVFEGPKGKYVRMVDENHLVYLFGRAVIEIQGRVADSYTSEKSLIKEIRILPSETTEYRFYIANLIDIFLRNQKLPVYYN